MAYVFYNNAKPTYEKPRPMQVTFDTQVKTAVLKNSNKQSKLMMLCVNWG